MVTFQALPHIQHLEIPILGLSIPHAAPQHVARKQHIDVFPFLDCAIYQAFRNTCIRTIYPTYSTTACSRKTANWHITFLATYVSFRNTCTRTIYPAYSTIACSKETTYRHMTFLGLCYINNIYKPPQQDYLPHIQDMSQESNIQT